MQSIKWIIYVKQIIKNGALYLLPIKDKVITNRNNFIVELPTVVTYCLNEKCERYANGSDKVFIELHSLSKQEITDFFFFPQLKKKK